MNIFHSNIIGIYGEKGKAWLSELPQLILALSLRFDLRDLKEVTPLSYNYLLSGFRGENPIILKLGLDHRGLKREAFALKCFADYGAIKVLFEEDGILVLERATPGTSLKGYFPHKEEESIEIVCEVMQKLYQAHVPATNPFPHIKDWLSILDKDWNIPQAYLKKARELRDELLQSVNPDVLLHGDLHHDNILQKGGGWVVIDPKGVMGEPAYEVAAFIRNPMPNLLSIHGASEIIQNRIAMFASLLNIPSKRILDWCFVQAVQAWAWALEDGCDPGYFERLTKMLDTLSSHQ